MSVAPHKQFWVPIIGILVPLILGMAPQKTLDRTEITIAEEKYLIEMARGWEERQIGLMWRSSLGDDEGMLLVYPQAGDNRIWMKNMLIPINVYWIDAEFRVIFHRRLEPCRNDPCPVYAAPAASQFVLELNDSKHAIQIGDVLNGVRF